MGFPAIGQASLVKRFFHSGEEMTVTVNDHRCNQSEDEQSNQRAAHDPINLTPLMTSNTWNTSTKDVYDLDDVVWALNSKSPTTMTNSSAGIASTFVMEPRCYHDHPFAHHNRNNGQNPSYQWYRGSDRDTNEVNNFAPFSPLIIFGDDSIDYDYYDEDCINWYHDHQTCEEKVSLLHNTRCDQTTKFHDSIKHGMSFNSSFSSFEKENTRQEFDFLVNVKEEESVSLLKAHNCQSWSERQIAFDLESVVEKGQLKDSEDEHDPFLIDESTLWMLQPDDEENLLPLAALAVRSSFLSLNSRGKHQRGLPNSRRKNHHKRVSMSTSRRRCRSGRSRGTDFIPKLSTVAEEEGELLMKSTDSDTFTDEATV